jgi:DNA-binding winged helix-turn-helix (wHTH) protein
MLRLPRRYALAEGIPRSVRFGVFELDRHSGELRKKGAKVRLQDKPLRILEALIEQPGVVISRDDLRRRLWSDDTFVDFDNGLNNAINRLRAALGDDANTPRFVETVGRRGYRFVASASSVEPAERSGNRPTAAERQGRGIGTRLVVLPFRVLRPDSETDFLAFSLADAVTAALSGLESMTVRSSIAAAKFAADQ